MDLTPPHHKYDIPSSLRHLKVKENHSFQQVLVDLNCTPIEHFDLLPVLYAEYTCNPHFKVAIPADTSEYAAYARTYSTNGRLLYPSNSDYCPR